MCNAIAYWRGGEGGGEGPLDLARFSHWPLVSKDGLAAAGTLAPEWEGNGKPLEKASDAPPDHPLWQWGGKYR
jgi:hypothetical protein